MEDLIISTLSVLGYPVFLQGSLLDNQPYPDSFFTFWNDAADAQSFHDDEESTVMWEYSINFYSTDPLKVNSALLDAKKLLRQQDFAIAGAGYDVASDEPTHTGRGISAKYLQIIKNNNLGG